MLFSEPKIPQSNSRRSSIVSSSRFSALQRAENSSIVLNYNAVISTQTVSVLFSEPKIPQSLADRVALAVAVAVSVLFSEPKIPQSM